MQKLCYGFRVSSSSEGVCGRWPAAGDGCPVVLHSCSKGAYTLFFAWSKRLTRSCIYNYRNAGSDVKCPCWDG